MKNEITTDAAVCPTCGNGRKVFCECSDNFHFALPSPAEGVDEAAEKANGYSLYGKGGDKYNAFNEGFAAGALWQSRQKPIKNARLEERRKSISQEVKDRVDGQSRQGGGGKSLAECKDEVARDNGFKDWNHWLSIRDIPAQYKYMDEIAELYATQFKSK